MSAARYLKDLYSNILHPHMVFSPLGYCKDQQIHRLTFSLRTVVKEKETNGRKAKVSTNQEGRREER